MRVIILIITLIYDNIDIIKIAITERNKNGEKSIIRDEWWS